MSFREGVFILRLVFRFVIFRNCFVSELMFRVLLEVGGRGRW